MKNKNSQAKKFFTIETRIASLFTEKDTALTLPNITQKTAHGTPGKPLPLWNKCLDEVSTVLDKMVKSGVLVKEKDLYKKATSTTIIETSKTSTAKARIRKVKK